MSASRIDRYLRKVPDFPIAGVLFYDIAPLLRDHFEEAITALNDLLTAAEWAQIELVAGIESRGFIFAAALAQNQRKGLVPIRKAGKLPPPVVSCTYECEYGTGKLEMPAGMGCVLIIDDVLATGGTLTAAANLSSMAGYEVKQLLVLISLGMVPGFQWQGMGLRAVVNS